MPACVSWRRSVSIQNRHFSGTILHYLCTVPASLFAPPSLLLGSLPAAQRYSLAISPTSRPAQPRRAPPSTPPCPSPPSCSPPARTPAAARGLQRTPRRTPRAPPPPGRSRPARMTRCAPSPGSRPAIHHFQHKIHHFEYKNHHVYLLVRLWFHGICRWGLGLARKVNMRRVHCRIHHFKCKFLVVNAQFLVLHQHSSFLMQDSSFYSPHSSAGGAVFLFKIHHFSVQNLSSLAQNDDEQCPARQFQQKTYKINTHKTYKINTHERNAWKKRIKTLKTRIKTLKNA